MPMICPPDLNSTLAIVPSESLALALTGMFAGAVKVAPLAGLVRLTVGGWFVGGPPLPLKSFRTFCEDSALL